MWDDPVGRLRLIAMIEGVSFLLLLGVAMPLKYLAGIPMAVRIVGLIHGILFMWVCWALYKVTVDKDWPLSKAAMVFVAALLPFGPFVIDGRLKEET